MTSRSWSSTTTSSSGRHRPARQGGREPGQLVAEQGVGEDEADQLGAFGGVWHGWLLRRFWCHPARADLPELLPKTAGIFPPSERRDLTAYCAHGLRPVAVRARAAPARARRAGDRRGRGASARGAGAPGRRGRERRSPPRLCSPTCGDRWPGTRPRPRCTSASPSCGGPSTRTARHGHPLPWSAPPAATRWRSTPTRPRSRNARVALRPCSRPVTRAAAYDELAAGARVVARRALRGGGRALLAGARAPALRGAAPLRRRAVRRDQPAARPRRGRGRGRPDRPGGAASDARAARRAARRRALPPAAAGRRPRRAPVDPRPPARRVRARPRSGPQRTEQLILAQEPDPYARPARPRARPSRPWQPARQRLPVGRTWPPSRRARRRGAGRRVRPRHDRGSRRRGRHRQDPARPRLRPTTSSHAAGARCGRTAPRTKERRRCGPGCRSSGSSAAWSRWLPELEVLVEQRAAPGPARSRPRTGGGRPSASASSSRPPLSRLRWSSCSTTCTGPTPHRRHCSPSWLPGRRSPGFSSSSPAGPLGRQVSQRRWLGWRGSAWSGSSSTD